MNSKKELIDISTVDVDPNLTKKERLEEFARQIKNPNHFICNDIEVTVSYADTDLTFEQCVMGIFT